MKKLKTLVSVFLITQLSLLAQDEVYKSIPKLMLDKANTAKNANYLSNNEKDVILYMNLARLDGNWFIEHVYKKKTSFVSQFSSSYRITQRGHSHQHRRLLTEVCMETLYDQHSD